MKASRILLAGFCINLCLGILYAWSVFNKALVTEAGWSAAEASSPYAIATSHSLFVFLLQASPSRPYGPT